MLLLSFVGGARLEEGDAAPVWLLLDGGGGLAAFWGVVLPFATWLEDLRRLPTRFLSVRRDDMNAADGWPERLRRGGRRRRRGGEETREGEGEGGGLWRSGRWCQHREVRPRCPRSKVAARLCSQPHVGSGDVGRTRCGIQE